MTRSELSAAILTLLRDSGLGFDEQVKAIAAARGAIQPRTGMDDWRTARDKRGIIGSAKKNEKNAGK